MPDTDRLSSTFAALADPTRRAILERLVQGEATLNELAEPFPMSLQAVSQHLKVLEQAGLVTRGRVAQQRPARLAVGSLGEATRWLERYITRVFDAPRELVFKAHTDPQIIPQWWGPRSLTTTVEALEVRPGGLWRFVHHDAAGNEYAFHGVYHAVAPPERLVYTFEFEGAPGHVVLKETLFKGEGDKTRSRHRGRNRRTAHTGSTISP